jgi:hypothetical protein
MRDISVISQVLQEFGTFFLHVSIGHTLQALRPKFRRKGIVGRNAFLVGTLTSLITSGPHVMGHLKGLAHIAAFRELIAHLSQLVCIEFA